MDTIFVRKRKRPSGSGLWSAYVLDVDHHGTWIFSPRGSLYRGEKDGVTGTCEVGQGSRDAGLDVLHLIPPNSWWFAWWARQDGTERVSIDICTPAVRIGTEWAYSDLEIDLLSPTPGIVEVHDEDEFEAAYAAGHISWSERVAALASTAELRRRLQTNTAPFDDTAWQRLDDAVALALPPLTDLP
jgi:uncharacterized protein DUF402